MKTLATFATLFKIGRKNLFIGILIFLLLMFVNMVFLGTPMIITMIKDSKVKDFMAIFYVDEDGMAIGYYNPIFALLSKQDHSKFRCFQYSDMTFIVDLGETDIIGMMRATPMLYKKDLDESNADMTNPQIYQEGFEVRPFKPVTWKKMVSVDIPAIMEEYNGSIVGTTVLSSFMNKFEKKLKPIPGIEDVRSRLKKEYPRSSHIILERDGKILVISDREKQEYPSEVTVTSFISLGDHIFRNDLAGIRSTSIDGLRSY